MYYTNFINVFVFITVLKQSTKRAKNQATEF